jgi:hypothetical protein
MSTNNGEENKSSEVKKLAVDSLGDLEKLVHKKWQSPELMLASQNFGVKTPISKNLFDFLVQVHQSDQRPSKVMPAATNQSELQRLYPIVSDELMYEIFATVEWCDFGDVSVIPHHLLLNRNRKEHDRYWFFGPTLDADSKKKEEDKDDEDREMEQENDVMKQIALIRESDNWPSLSSIHEANSRRVASNVAENVDGNDIKCKGTKYYNSIHLALHYIACLDDVKGATSDSKDKYITFGAVGRMFLNCGFTSDDEMDTLVLTTLGDRTEISLPTTITRAKLRKMLSTPSMHHQLGVSKYL